MTGTSHNTPSIPSRAILTNRPIRIPLPVFIGRIRDHSFSPDLFLHNSSLPRNSLIPPTPRLCFQSQLIMLQHFLFRAPTA